MVEKPNKRQFLKAMGAVGTTGVVGMAGCLGDDDTADGTEPDEDYWPPPRDQIEVISPYGPGSSNPVMNRIWLNSAAQYMPGDIRTTVTYSEGAQGMVAAQETWNAPPDGSTIGGQFISEAGHMELTLPEVSYENFRYFANYYQDLMGIQISHHSRDIDDHFQLEWQDLVEMAEEEPLTLGISLPVFQVVTEYTFRRAPDFDEDMYEIIPFDGGGAIREGMLSGDLDGRFVGATSSYPTDRTEFSKLQIILGDPDDYPDFADQLETLESGDGLRDGVPRDAWLVNQDFPEDIARDIGRLFVDGIATMLPPGTPDEVAEIFEDAYTEAIEDEERSQEVIDTLGEMREIPTIGEEEVSEIVGNTVETMLDDDLFLELSEDL